LATRKQQVQCPEQPLRPLRITAPLAAHCQWQVAQAKSSPAALFLGEVGMPPSSSRRGHLPKRPKQYLERWGRSAGTQSLPVRARARPDAASSSWTLGQPHRAQRHDDHRRRRDPDGDRRPGGGACPAGAQKMRRAKATRPEWTQALTLRNFRLSKCRYQPLPCALRTK
jgi:hypothetical protein